MKGRFLVLEGIDGCGKTTQINHIYKWLPASGLMPKGARLHITREPGGTDLGKALRDLLLNFSEEESPEELTELLLYAADRAQHINKFILPRLDKGDWVICDRFSGSTMAYQGYGRGININLINNLEAIVTQGFKPDLTLLLKLSVSQSIQRRKDKSEDRMEAEGESFLNRVAKGFSSIAEEEGWVSIEAEKVEELVTKEIKSRISLWLNNL